MDKKLQTILESVKRGGIKSSVLEKNGTNHFLIKGSCEEIIKHLPDNSVDLIITDPPYNKGLHYGNGFNDSKPWKKYYDQLKSQLAELPRILSPQGNFYLISYPEINARLLPFLEDELKLNYRRWITWHYPTNIGHSRKNFTRSQRSVLFFAKTKDYIFNREHLIQHYKNPTAPVIRKRLAMGSKGRTSYDLLRFIDLVELQEGLIDILDIDLLKNNSRDRFRNLKSKFRPMTPEELRKKDHPCQLPLGLLELFVKVSSNKGGIVFDPFAGTCTTALAAAKSGRNSISVEIIPKFVNFGVRRMKSFQV